MAKKNNKSPSKAAASPTIANVDAETAKKLGELKAEGNNSFARGDFNKALSVYEDAIKLLPSGAPERADFHNNKAACYIGQKRYKEAVKECTSALEVAPGSLRALQRRAKAYEHQGLYRQALNDIVVINKTDNASADTQETERRLREAAKRQAAPTAGGGAAGTGGGALARATAAAGAKGLPSNTLQQGMFTAKCSLGDETKLLHLSLASNYADLLAAVQQKFPNAGPLCVKYVDKDHDVVTISSKLDLHMALSELVAQYQRQLQAGGHGPKLNAFPPLRLQIVPVASVADVPRPPPEEEQERLQQQAALQQLRAGQAGAAEQKKDDAPEQVATLDSWLLEFANLFVQATGLEPEKHIDLHQYGWDNAMKALDTVLHGEQAAPLFDKAKDSFRDVACSGLTSWGQTHYLSGTRLVDMAVRAGKKAQELPEEVAKEWAEAERRYREALAYNAEFFDALCNMSQLEFERCKIAAAYLQPDTKPAEGDAASSGKTPEEAAAAQQETMAAALRGVLEGLDAKVVADSKHLFDSALSWVDKAIASAPAMDEKHKEQQARAAEQGQVIPPMEFSFKSQALVMKGNFIYEWSQMLAGVKDASWREVLDGAVALFREAACPEKDVRGALRNHYKADELDIPKEEEEAAEQPAAAAPVAAAPAAAAEPAGADAAAKAEPKEEKAKAPEAKGLPSLEVKRTKK